MTEFCTPAELRVWCQTERIRNENYCYLGDSAPKIKEAEQKEKMLLYSGYFQVKKTSPYTLSLLA